MDKYKEDYEYLQKCYLEARQRGENYRVQAVEVTESLKSVLQSEKQLTILNSEMEGDKKTSKVPRWGCWAAQPVVHDSLIMS